MLFTLAYEDYKKTDKDDDAIAKSIEEISKYILESQFKLLLEWAKRVDNKALVTDIEKYILSPDSEAMDVITKYKEVNNYLNQIEE